ncbi:unnamed protein product [Blepharisma stoltei]|uniref:START domain-containing protein n=1 Tax=Blepharisma stoltei TaxID=1481888 RepID=A0AAU9JXX2_9CILI|nr:unnamed protein product [Blepharisma stoltei]
MGNAASKMCLECFKPADDDPLLPEKELEESHPQLAHIPDPKVQIKTIDPMLEIIEEQNTVESIELDDVPSGPIFDVGLLGNLLDKATADFVAHLQAPMQEEGCQEMSKKDGFLIYAKEVPEGVMVKGQWYMPYGAREFFDFMTKVEDRCRWDKSLETVNIIAKYPPDVIVTHSKFKKVPMISSRDVLLVSRVEKAHNGTLLINTSCDHPDLEPTENIVRATVKLSGYYVEPIQMDEAGNKSKVVYINIVNFGGKVPKSIVKSTSANHIPAFVKKLHSELALIVSK